MQLPASIAKLFGQHAEIATASPVLARAPGAIIGSSRKMRVLAHLRQVGYQLKVGKVMDGNGYLTLPMSDEQRASTQAWYDRVSPDYKNDLDRLNREAGPYVPAKASHSFMGLKLNS